MKAAAQDGRTDVGAVALSRGGGRVAEQLDQTCIAGDGRNAGEQGCEGKSTGTVCARQTPNKRGLGLNKRGVGK
jgi:hypothetical protein